MAAILGIDQDAVFGKLMRVWIWADLNSADGNALSVPESFLDRMTCQAGFADAMRQAGWLKGPDGKLSFPGFDRHNGQSAKGRALTNTRKDKFKDKERKRNDESVPGAFRERSQNKSKSKNKNPPKSPEGDCDAPPENNGGAKNDPKPTAAEKVLMTYKGNKLSGEKLDWFERFWDAFNLKTGKAKAAESWRKIPSLNEELVTRICQAADTEAERRKNLPPDRTPKYAQGWLTERRWDDEDLWQAAGVSNQDPQYPENWKELLRQVLDTDFAHVSEEVRKRELDCERWSQLAHDIQTAIVEKWKKIK